MQAKASTLVFSLECPNCDEAIVNENGSFDFVYGDIRKKKDNTIECSNCGKVLVLPKTARIV